MLERNNTRAFLGERKATFSRDRTHNTVGASGLLSKLYRCKGRTRALTGSGAFSLKRSCHPHNLAAKNIILKNVKLLQNDNETGRIFSQPPLVSFKRDKNIGNFLVRSVLKSDDQPGTFECARKRCNICPFIHNADKITGPKQSIKITDRFTCTSANVIYCITCTLCKKIYISETGRRLGDRFREHLREVERNDKDASKPVARPTFQSP